MRLITVLLIASIMQVSASSYGQKITLSEKNAPLTKVFSKIRSQIGYDFLFTSSVLKDAKTVSINVENADLKAVLNSIFEGQPLSYSIEDKSVIISKKNTLFSPDVILKEALTVQGFIRNENGKPLDRANLQVLGTPFGYMTGPDGYYSLQNVREDANLVVSYVGYKTDTIPVRGRREINITMTLVSATIKEVNIISTGYQVLSKERATGSYAKPDMETFRSRSATMDIMSRLDGLVPGLTVISGPTGSGANRYGTGASQQSILRGKGTVSLSSEPLYVVDGVQVPNLSYINPNDVADITILKDAAATAIYGVKAANGVIVVVTKHGKRNEKVQINYNGYISFQGKPHYKEGLYMNSAQYIQTAKELFDPVAYPWNLLSNSFIAPHELVLYNKSRGLTTTEQANKSLDSLSGIDNRQQVMDLMYRNAFATNHTLSASGGSRTYSFYTGLSYTNNHSNEPEASNDTYRITLNQTINPAKWLTINLSTAFNNAISKSAKPISVGPDFLPYQLFRDANGNNIQMNYIQGLSPETRANWQARSRLDLNYIPLDELNRGYGKNNLLNINNMANIDVKLFKGLSFNGTYGYQRSPGTSTSYDDISSYGMKNELLRFTIAATPQQIPVYYLPTTGGRFNTRSTNSQNWTVRNQLVYTSSLRSGKDRVNIQVGQEALEQSNNMVTTILRGYDDVLKTYSLLDYVTLANPIFGAIGSGYSMFDEKPYDLLSDKNRTTSYFGLFNYSFNDRYQLDASIRSDRSSLFASTSSGQKKPSYSIGGKWLLSKEDFIRQVSWIDNLGLRLTYGLAGNSPYIGSGSIVDVLNVNVNSKTGNSLTLLTPANNKLSWESTHTINGGIDFGILKSRLSGNIDVYRKNTTNLIGNVKYNPLTGTESATGNIGNIRNTGIEIALQSINIRQATGFSWTTGLVFSYNRNKLLSYSIPSQNLQTANAWVSGDRQVGYSNPAMFAYRFAGLDNMGDPQIKLTDGTVTKARDKAATTDLVYMGTPFPKFNGGLSNTFRYKGLSLAANISYSLGGVMRRNVNYFYAGRMPGSAGSFSGSNLLAEFENRWKKMGDEATTNVPSYVANQGLNFTRRNLDYYTFADINVISASYIKLRDITLSYELAPALMRQLRLEKISLFAQSGNYMLWKANKVGVDPEYQGLEKGGRSYSLGLNVTF